MTGKGTTTIFITFLLAMIGYAGLTTIVLISLRKRVPIVFWRIVAAVIFVHVIMVWAYRYDWQFSVSVRNGFAGFIIFHSALLMILFSTIAKESIAKILILISFITVTIGAVGAVFRYNIVEFYKIPVILCAVAGSAGLIRILFERKKLLIKKNNF